MVTIKPGVCCDPCIASLVATLNYGGIETVASCCGHGEQPGSIALADGRELLIRPQHTGEPSAVAVRWPDIFLDRGGPR